MKIANVGPTHWSVAGLAALTGANLAIVSLYHYLFKGQGTQTTADFGHGIIAVKHGDLWGVFAVERQQVVLPFEFNSIRVLPRHPDAKPKYVELNKDGLVGLYSFMEWRFVIPILYKQIIKINDDLCAVQGPDDKWGVFSIKRDHLVMPVEYPGYKAWHNCYDFVGVPYNDSGNCRWAIFSFEKQRVVTRYVYDRFDYLGGGIFKLQAGQRKRRDENKHLRFGLYLHHLGLVIRPVYTSIEKFGPDFLKLQSGSVYGLFSTKTGRIVVPVEHWSIRHLPDGELQLQSRQGKKTIALNILHAAQS